LRQYLDKSISYTLKILCSIDFLIGDYTLGPMKNYKKRF